METSGSSGPDGTPSAQEVSAGLRHRAGSGRVLCGSDGAPNSVLQVPGFKGIYFKLNVFVF